MDFTFIYNVHAYLNVLRYFFSIVNIKFILNYFIHNVQVTF